MFQRLKYSEIQRSLWQSAVWNGAFEFVNASVRWLFGVALVSLHVLVARVLALSRKI